MKEPKWHIFFGENVLFKFLRPTAGKNYPHKSQYTKLNFFQLAIFVTARKN